MQFCVADLLHPPPEWQGAFGLVFEAYTLQALPWKLRQQAARRMASFVAPGGELLVVCYGREEDEDAGQLPWPLSQSELNAFSEAGLEEVNFQDVTGERGIREFVVTFRRPAP